VFRSVKSSSQYRIPYLDGLRGIAALAVAVLHIFGARAAAFPKPIASVILQGFLGVQLFFVVSGFVIAHVLSAKPLDGPTARRFLLRRVLRLDPPYWASIALVLLAAAVSNVVLTDRRAPMPPASLVLAHLLYLQDFLGLPHICEVYWTLCFEIQFYLLLMLTFVVRRSLCRRGVNESLVDGIVFGLPAIYSLLVLAGTLPAPRGSCFGSWCLFLAGVLAQRHTTGQLRTAWLVAFLGSLLAIAVVGNDLRPAVAATVAGSIAIGHRRELLTRWLAGPVVQYLGKISYSLYLIHPIVGQHLPNLGYRLTGGGAIWVAIWGCLGLGAAIGASHLFWRAVEAPSIALSRRVSDARPRAMPAPALSP
jgi:peptidoglycan/LPS O-acetylase OafA/YrhL